MTKPIQVLLQTTIPFREDDWHIGRFSLLRKHLESLRDESGNRLCEVTARDRENTPAARRRVPNIHDGVKRHEEGKQVS